MKDPAWVGDLVGMVEAEARIAAAEEGVTVRIIARDGNYRVVTRDYREDRVNFKIEVGVVTEADIG
jgi:hypothetical protein